ncbi:primosomal replication protein N [Pelistega ratti]|uniref:primosomal replication protein N n=1 Tax=Pelistega ratti TaxID=2652177 RepID=UPI00135A73E3|nr:primosomal replication protein N [Pelistega ratti]
MNQVYLEVRVIEVKPLRLTPAGIPVQELIVEHCSEVVEAGHLRKVEFVLSARAIGHITQLLQNLTIGTVMKVEGFLAASRKHSTKLVLHLQKVQIPDVSGSTQMIEMAK